MSTNRLGNMREVQLDKVAREDKQLEQKHTKEAKARELETLLDPDQSFEVRCEALKQHINTQLFSLKKSKHKRFFKDLKIAYPNECKALDNDIEFIDGIGLIYSPQELKDRTRDEVLIVGRT